MSRWGLSLLLVCAASNGAFGAAPRSDVSNDEWAAPPLTWHAQTLIQSSVWREQNASGGQILEERGSLHGMALGVAGRASWLTWSATAQALSGVRDYEGRTNQGTPLLTRSDIQDARLSLALQAPLTSNWCVGAMAEPGRTLRNLRGTSAAMGYRETWRWTLAEASLRWMQGDMARGWSAEVGLGLAFRPTVHVALPNFDPAVLHPERGRSQRLDVQYRGALGHATADATHPHWRWVAGLGWRRLVFGASAAELLTRQGIWQGGLSQPQTLIQAGQWRLGLETDWP